MKRLLRVCRADWRALLVMCACALTVVLAGGAAAAAPRIDTAELTTLGFKVLVATNKVQEDWVKTLAPGKVRALQRNGRKFYVYPDPANRQVYVGGPAEYEALMQVHPDARQSPQDAAAKASAYRGKQNESMQKATARDLSDPFLGASWADLGW